MNKKNARLLGVLSLLLGGDGSLYAFSFAGKTGESGSLPVEIDAASGITCEKKGQVCTARGNVIVTHGDTTLTCDVLKAFFHMDNQDRPQELIRLEAHGNVRIKAKEGAKRAAADVGVFHVKTSHAVLTGRDLFLALGETNVRARDSLEYFEQKKLAVAKGEASVEKKGKLLKADQLDAYFKESHQKDTLDHVVATGNVFASTQDDVAQGDRGVYTDADEVVILTGNVRITKRGQGRMMGERGRYDMKNGFAALLPAENGGQNPSASPKSRVKVLLIPRQEKSA
jgi:lipopolysaccharide export system protein LptA